SLFTATPPSATSPLSLHDALPISQVTAVDIDEQAVRATRENAERNRVADRIGVSLTQGCDSGPYDIILANILARPLIDLAPTLRSEEHTSELQSRFDLVCRLLLEK